MWNVLYRFSLYSERLFHGPYHRQDPSIAHPVIKAKPSTLMGKGGIIRSQLNVTQKYLPTTDGAGHIRDKVKACLVGEGTVKILLITVSLVALRYSSIL
jgi:hypothetical protein